MEEIDLMQLVANLVFLDIVTLGFLLNAEFSDEDASAVFKINTPSVTTATSKVFGLHVYGDMSGNELQLQFRSEISEDEVRYLKICDLNFFGWEFVEAQFTEVESYKLIGIRIVRKESVLSASTEIYIDNLLQYAEPTGLKTNKFDNSISIYPNPASDIIKVNGLSGDSKLRLYSVDGRFIKESTESQLSVQEIEQGTYILKIDNLGKTITRPIFIVR